MRLKFNDDLKARIFIEKSFKGQDVDEAVQEWIEKVPPSCKSEYGETDAIVVANYYVKWVLKENYISAEEILAGGGLFKALKQGHYLMVEPLTIFTVIPEGDKMRIVMPRSEHTLLVDKASVIRALEEGEVGEFYKTAGRKSSGLCKRKLNKEEKQQLKDFQQAITYLQRFYRKYKIEKPADILAELDMMAMAVSEEWMANYPDTQEGRIVALAAYVAENKEAVSNALSKYPALQGDSPDRSIISTGSVFYSTRDTEYFSEDRVLTLYHNREEDKFILAVVSGDMKKYAAWQKVIVGLLAATVVAMLVPAVPVAVAAVGAGGTYAATVTKEVQLKMSRKSLLDTYVELSRVELEDMLKDKTLVHDAQIWDSIKYLYL